MRLGKTQALILQLMRDRGGVHVYIGAGMKADCLAGHFFEEVERSLKALVRRGVVIEVKSGFYTLPESARGEVNLDRTSQGKARLR
jgi:hypothetical protein